MKRLIPLIRLCQMSSLQKQALRLPSRQATVAVRVDPETLASFQLQGESAQRHMAAALRIYVQAQKYTDTWRKSA